MATKANKPSVKTPTLKRKGKPQTNPNSLANLQPPWQPGIPSPNPGGRPKLLSDAYREYLATQDTNTGRTRAQDIAMAQGVQALQGETQAAKELRQATEGDVFNFKNLNDDNLDRLISQLEKLVGPSETGTSATPANASGTGAAGEVGGA